MAMADTITPIRVFISSPGDLVPERAVVSAVLDELNRSPIFRDRFKLIPYAWEVGTPPVVGVHAQEAVDTYLIRSADADIVIGLLWLRMGAPQERVDPETNQPYQSGTEYELLTAYHAHQTGGRPLILLYRCVRTPQDAATVDREQAERVDAFFSRFQPGGDLQGLTGSFDDVDSLREKLRYDLSLLLEHHFVALPGAFTARRAPLALADAQQLPPVENSTLEGQYGDTGILRHERAQIIEQIDAFASVVQGPLLPVLRGSSHAATVEQRNRRVMLTKVRSIWIEGLLERSLTEETRIALNLTERPDAVELPLNALVQELNRPPQPLPPGMPIIDVFDKMGGELLILGAPGAGKTMMLLELTRDLIDRAEQDETYPMPIVFNLSSWAEKQKPLVDWLVDELNTKYDIPRKIGQAWVDADRVLPMLDGLDEVKQEYREVCVKAINRFRQRHGLASIVICSRVADYEVLSARLKLQGAVLIQPLTAEQIEAYLERTASQLVTLYTAPVQDVRLRELAESPLMLSIMVLAYHNVPADALAMSGTFEEQRRDLFAAYVERMFARRGMEVGYSRAWIEHWLAWLAQGMMRQGQTVFFIEHLQPEWLPTRRMQSLYVLTDRLGLGLILGLVSGLVSWPSLGLREGLLLGMFSTLLGALFGGGPQTQSDSQQAIVWSLTSTILKQLIKGLGLGLVSGLLLVLLDELVLDLDVVLHSALRDGLIFGLAAVLLGSLVGGPSVQPRHILVVEGLRWSWSKALQAVLGGLGLGLMVGLFFALDLGLFQGLGVGLGLELLVGLLAGMTGGAVEASMTPNQGIWRSARSALQGGMPSGLVSGLGLRFLLQAGNVRVFGLLLIVLGGLAGAFASGGYAVCSHLALRLVLWRNGAIPWNYARFLDYCVGRIFLRKVGGGYIFIHRLLMEYFASLYDPASPDSTSRADQTPGS